MPLWVSGPRSWGRGRCGGRRMERVVDMARVVRVVKVAWEC